MTDNRETIAMLKMLKEQALKSHNDTAVLEVKIDSFNFVLDEAIKALEQEPCDDCISRQAVLALPTSKTKTLSGEIIEEEVNIELIKDLPSVTPKEKTGHWIFDEILDRHYYCSECKSMGVDYWDYCPECGARMVSE